MLGRSCILVFFIIVYSDICASDYNKSDYPQLTNIQTVYVETFDNEQVNSKTEYKLCRFILVSDTGVVKIDSVQIRGRGNASWLFKKKPYRIKFPQKIRLLGNEYANAKSWIFLSNGGEKLLIRNALANYVSKICNMPFTPATRFVDFYLNDEYLGNYQITDFVEIRKKRIDIEEIDTIVTDPNANITGGYLLEADGRSDSGKIYIRTPVFNNNIRIHSPEAEVITESQKNYIRDYLGKFEKALAGGGSFYNYVDSASLMGWYLTNEICANCDLFFQIYFYKQRDDDRLYFSPVWDFDLGFNDDTRRGDGGDVSEYLMQDIDFESRYIQNWFDSIKTDPWWKHAQFEAYKKLYVDKNLDSLMCAFVDSITSLIRPSVEKNYEKWSISEQTHLEYKLYSTYDEYVRDLREFISIHNAYIYNQFQCRSIGIESSDIRPIEYPSKMGADYILSFNQGENCLHFLSDRMDVLNFRVDIIDLGGRIIDYFYGYERYNTSKLKAGTYIIRWNDGDKTRSLKFVVK